MMMIGKCKKCDKEIIWIETIKRKWMPCDEKEQTVITQDGKTVKGYTPHWATCANAAQFRNK